jgi:hypothetical protein
MIMHGDTVSAVKSYRLPKSAEASPDVSPGLAIPKINRLPTLEFIESFTCPTSKNRTFHQIPINIPQLCSHQMQLRPGPELHLVLQVSSRIGQQKRTFIDPSRRKTF